MRIEQDYLQAVTTSREHPPEGSSNTEFSSADQFSILTGAYAAPQSPPQGRAG